MGNILASLTRILIACGCLVTAAAMGLSLSGSSLCSSGGCKIVEDYLSVDPIFMYALGFLFFCLLFVAEHKEKLRQYGPPLLMFALAVEGYLVGFQLFVIHAVCFLCVTVALIVVTIGLLKLFGESRRPIINGFLLLMLTCSLVGFINIPSAPIPSGGHDVLIYSKECPHCEEVIRFSKKSGIQLTLYEVNKVRNMMVWLGIDAVPVLICNDATDKKIYIGSTKIEKVLAAKYGHHAYEVLKPIASPPKAPPQLKHKAVTKRSEKKSEAPAADGHDILKNTEESVFPLEENDATCSTNRETDGTCK